MSIPSPQSVSPKVSIKLTLSPSTYSFSCPIPPTLSLVVTSHAPSPITVYTWMTMFDPGTGLDNIQFPTTDITNPSMPLEVPQNRIHVQRYPPSIIKGSADDKNYLTLQPNEPVTVSTGFSLGWSKGITDTGANGPRPQPKHITQRGRAVDEEGRELQARRPTKATGVDGLESGKHYAVRLREEALEDVWWVWGTREDVLVSRQKDGTGRNRGDGETAELQLRESVESVEFQII